MTMYDKLLSYVPPFVREDPVMAEYYAAVAPDLEAAAISVKDIPKQILPHLVTWGISRLERIFGIQVDDSLPLSSRRSALVAKLRSSGISTLAQIQSIAQSYASGAIGITELYAENKVNIEFIDELGVPVYLESLKSALRAAVPAHLAIEFVLRWLTWGELAASGKTWAELSAAGITFEQLKSYDIV